MEPVEEGCSQRMCVSAAGRPGRSEEETGGASGSVSEAGDCRELPCALLSVDILLLTRARLKAASFVKPCRHGYKVFSPLLTAVAVVGAFVLLGLLSVSVTSVLLSSALLSPHQ